MIGSTTSVRTAAKALRAAQRAYMSDRGNEALGKAVGEAAERLDVALAATEVSTGDVNRGALALWDSFCPGIRRTPVDDAHFGCGARAVLEAVNFPALKAAGLRLYMAAKWSADRPVNEAQLWEDFRDALGIKPGTATAAGIHADASQSPEPHGCPACDDAMECDCEPPLPMFDTDEGAAAAVVDEFFNRPGAEL